MASAWRHAGPVAEAALSTEPELAGLGPLAPIEARCQCQNGERRVSLRRVSQGSDAVRRLIGGIINPDLPFLTYRCTDCGGTAVLTLGDAGLA